MEIGARICAEEDRLVDFRILHVDRRGRDEGRVVGIFEPGGRNAGHAPVGQEKLDVAEAVLVGDRADICSNRPKVHRIARIVAIPHPGQEIERHRLLLDVVQKAFAERTFIQGERDTRPTDLQVRVDAFHSARSSRVHVVELLGRAGEVQGAEVGLVAEFPMRDGHVEPVAPTAHIMAHDMLHDLPVFLQVLHGLLVAWDLAGNGEQDVGA